ncbi:MAG: hypothetical protein GY854_29210 [Deltaproteobacteria bacterium]|nr:hypothetical protein [Deltaproteobacteria bacterium]
MNGNDVNRYNIRIACHLSGLSATRFDGVTVSNQAGGEALLETEAIDQSGLHGLLARIRDLNIRLISVERTNA